MSIAVLAQVYDEARRLAIAGSAVAGGDFRLKKLVAPLQSAGAKAPVFLRVAEAAEKVVEAPEQSSADALLELCTLVNSILYTQGETGVEGELSPIRQIAAVEQQGRIGAHVLRPVVEALSRSGSGRLEIIRDAHAKGVFRDPRLVRPAIRGLDDSFADIAFLLATEVLPQYGPFIFDDVKAGFDPKSKRGELRLRLLIQLDPVKARQFVDQAIEIGSKEMRVVALAGLGDAPGDLHILLEHAKSKVKDIRIAALSSLCRLDAPQAVEAVHLALTGADAQALSAEVSRVSRKSTASFVLNLIVEGIEEALIERERRAAIEKVDRILSLFHCRDDWSDPEAAAFLIRLFADRNRICTLRTEYFGQPVLEAVASRMVVANAKTRKTLIDAADSLDGPAFGHALHAAQLTCPPAEIYDRFCRFLIPKPVNAKREGEHPADRAPRDRRGMIVNYLGGDVDYSCWRPSGIYPYCMKHPPDSPKPDPRWMERAIDAGDERAVCHMFEPGHARAEAFLRSSFDTSLSGAKEPNELHVLDVMVEKKHPYATDAMGRTLSKYFANGKKFSEYGLFWVCELIGKMPPASAPTLEAVARGVQPFAAGKLLATIDKLKLKAEQPGATDGGEKEIGS